MKISKKRLSRSRKKYYRFFFKNKSAPDYLIPGSIIHKFEAVLEDSIFFTDEDHILKWITHGDTLVEVSFDSTHPSYCQLPNTYFVENEKYCGNAILTGRCIDLNSIEMYEFICRRWNMVADDFHALQRHLILASAFDTLKMLWEFKYSVCGSIDREDDMAEALVLLRIRALECNRENASKILFCKDFDTLIAYINTPYTKSNDVQ